jgi:hypothetical protein
MNIKRIVFAVVLLLATTGVAWAGKEAYEIVMSKDKGVCETMLKTYNSDMRRFRDIRYGEHEIFKRVPWHKFELGEQTYGCELFWRGHFDINNDGKEDLVIKRSACLRDNLSDSFYMFPGNSDVLMRLKSGPGGLDPLFETSNKFARTSNAYVLAELPLDQTEGIAQDIGGIFVIQPFIWDKKTYLSMTDLHQEWIVINQYQGEDRFQDICYFHGKSRLQH